jgi:chromosome segregation ATPase
MRTGHKILLILIALSLVLGAIIFFNMRGNNVEAGYMRWAIANNVSLFLASPMKFLAGESGSVGGSSPLMYIGIGGIGLVFMLIMLKFTGDSETVSLRKRVKELDAAKNEAERALQEQVWKGKTDRQAKESAMKDLESSIDKIEILLNELGEKERLLKIRESEVVSLKTDPSARAGMVPGRGPANERMLGEELRKKSEALQTRDATIKDLEQRLSAKTSQWENQLREKERQIKGREGELEGLRYQINDLTEQLADMEAARKRTEERFQEEARRRREMIEASELSSKAEEQRLGEQIRMLEGNVIEREKLLKSRESEINNFRRQLEELAVAKEQAESLLKEQAGQSGKWQQAKDAAIKELEQRYAATVQGLKTEVGEKDLLLEVRDGEINSLKSEVKAVAGRFSELTAAKERVEASLQEALRKEEMRGPTDLASRELEERYSAELTSVANQLREREELLQARGAELAELKSEMQIVNERLTEMSAVKECSEATLQEELRRERQQREAREATTRELEERYAKELDAVANQLRESEEFLHGRDGELTALRSEVKAITGRLNDATTAKERADASWQEELRKERQRRESRETTNRELEERYSSELTKLANQLREKEESLAARDGELMALSLEVKAITGRLNDMAVAKERAEAAWQEELRKEHQQRESREVANRELEDRHAGELQNLANQLGEKDEALKGRDGELLALKTQLASLAEQLGKVESAKERAAALLQEKIKNEKLLRKANDSALKELEENFKGKIAVLEEQLSEKLQTMGSRDSQLQALTSELSLLNRRLSDIESAKEKAESLFSEAVREKEELAAAKNASIRELEDDLSNKMRAFEARLNDREELLKGRDAELSTIKKQLTEIGAAKEQATRLLQEELRKKSEELEEKESARKVLEEQLIGQLRTMESQLIEQRDQLSGRDAELAALTAKAGNLANQLTDANAAKDQTTRSLHDEIRKKTEELEQREAHAKALEERFAERVQSLESRLTEQRDQLNNRDAELAGLTTKLGSLTSQLNDATASKDHTTRSLHDEIRKKSEELAQYEAQAKALEERFAERVRALESELTEQRERLTGREVELAGLTAKLGSLTNQLADAGNSKEETARLLQEEIRKRTAELEEREAHARALEERLTERARSLESDLSEQHQELAKRETEVAGLTAKVASLTSQLSNVGTSQDKASRLLQEEAREKAELLAAKEAALKGLEERLSSSLRSLETQLGEKQEMLDMRDSEAETLIAKVSSLAAQVADLEAARGRAERQLQDELRDKDALLQSKDSDLNDLEERLGSRLKTLERQVNDKQKLLESTSVEMSDMRAQMSVLEEQLKESENAKTWLENALHEERNKESQALIVADNHQPAVLGDGAEAAENGESDGLDNIRSEREALLKARDKLINDLMGELKEKKSQLAKHEIEVWQGIERRGVWKHRLSKIGIRLKD